MTAPSRRTGFRKGSTLDQMREAELPPPTVPARRPTGHQRGVTYEPGTRVEGWSHGPAGKRKVEQKVAMLRVVDCSPTAISRALKLSRERVTAILGRAETAGLVEDFRKLIRAHALSESLDIAVKGMAWVNEAIERKEAKEFDLVTRGLSNMEKIWASAAGEHKPMGVQVAVVNNQPPGESPASEIAKLLDFLIPPVQP
jgi:DNA-binding Lrp family transcriptional regulator